MNIIAGLARKKSDKSSRNKSTIFWTAVEALK